MSVLIRGMEMPTSCFDCPFLYGRMHCSANSKIEFNDPDYSELKGRYDGCPLVPIPPHGRLIDADAFEQHIKEDWNEYDHWIAAEVENRPTVLEAEEEADG